MTYFGSAETMSTPNPALMHLQHIASGAYKTEAEDKSLKALLEYHYEAKRNVCIVSLVTIIALGIILGATVNPYHSLILLGIFVPIGVWSYLGRKHSDLEKIHEADYQTCLSILKSVAEFLSTLRLEKLKLLQAEASTNRNHSVHKNLQTIEAEYDKAHNYEAVSLLAKRAYGIIKLNYQDPREIERYTDNNNPVLGFLKACEILFLTDRDVYSAGTERERINNSSYQTREVPVLVQKKASYHPHYTLLAGPLTEFKS